MYDSYELSNDASHTNDQPFEVQGSCRRSPTLRSLQGLDELPDELLQIGSKLITLPNSESGSANVPAPQATQSELFSAAESKPRHPCAILNTKSTSISEQDLAVARWLMELKDGQKPALLRLRFVPFSILKQKIACELHFGDVRRPPRIVLVVFNWRELAHEWNQCKGNDSGSTNSFKKAFQSSFSKSKVMRGMVSSLTVSERPGSSRAVTLEVSEHVLPRIQSLQQKDREETLEMRIQKLTTELKSQEKVLLKSEKTAKTRSTRLAEQRGAALVEKKMPGSFGEEESGQCFKFKAFPKFFGCEPKQAFVGELKEFVIKSNKTFEDEHCDVELHGKKGGIRSFDVFCNANNNLTFQASWDKAEEVRVTLRFEENSSSSLKTISFKSPSESGSSSTSVSSSSASRMPSELAPKLSPPDEVTDLLIQLGSGRNNLHQGVSRYQRLLHLVLPRLFCSKAKGKGRILAELRKYGLRLLSRLFRRDPKLFKMSLRWLQAFGRRLRKGPLGNSKHLRRKSLLSSKRRLPVAALPEISDCQLNDLKKSKTAEESTTQYADLVLSSSLFLQAISDVLQMRASVSSPALITIVSRNIENWLLNFSSAQGDWREGSFIYQENFEEILPCCHYCVECSMLHSGFLETQITPDIMTIERTEVSLAKRRKAGASIVIDRAGERKIAALLQSSVVKVIVSPSAPEWLPATFTAKDNPRRPKPAYFVAIECFKAAISKLQLIERGFHAGQFEVDDMFETEDAADEWLSYPLVRKNQEIEKKLLSFLLLESDRALISVIKCVLCDIGRTLLHYACSSFVDTIKKMTWKNEHGCIFPLVDDIVLAASSGFSLSEKADEIFHYVVNEKGLSVAAIDKFDNTSLHFACLSGSISGVKFLVEHNAAINSIGKNGSTPIMLACRSSIDRLSKVCYLGEKGADCQAKDHEGKTALFYATFPSDCEDDVKIVLQYLVKEKGININSVNENGRTPLLYACCHHPSFAVIQRLIELGADVSARNKKEQTALHMAVQSYSKVDRSIIDLLIEKGCDVIYRDKNGKTPYEVAYDGEMRALLRQHYDAARFSVLQQREMVRLDSIKLCVVGSRMAGKTTLVNSLLRCLPPPKEEDRTAGVKIHHCEIPGVGKGSIWDFGAQPTFHNAHGLFFGQSNTIFVLVLRLRDGQQMTSEIFLLEIGRYRCAFVKAALRTIFPNLTSRLRLFIVFNLIGFEEDAGIEVSFQLKRIAQTLQKEFDDTFEILHIFEMDCIKCNSLRMNAFRWKLKTIRENLLKEANKMPKLCHVIEEKICLPDEERMSPLRNFMAPEEFLKWGFEDVRITLNENEKKKCVEYLDSFGIIVNLGPRICPRPQWLCHNVVGPLLAPPDFPFGMPSQTSGEVSFKDIESALKAFEDDLKKRGTSSSITVTAEEAIQVLIHLDLCIRVENSPEKFQIPALLQDSIRHDAWIEDAMFDVYRGQRYECSRCVDIISPSSFVVFQSRCSRMTKPTRREAWKDGVKLVRIVDDKLVESRIELGRKKSHCCIDIILRWSSKRACDEVAKEFLAEIKDMIMRVCDERSPGTILNWFYLDSKHLKQLDEDPAIYSMIDVEMKVSQQAFDHVLFSVRPENGQHSSVRDLYILTEEELAASRRERISLSLRGGEMSQDNPTKEEADPYVAALPVSFSAYEEFVSDDLMKVCVAFKGSKWEDLLSLEKVEDIRKLSSVHWVKGLLSVLEECNTAKARTVGELLAAFEAVCVNRFHIKNKYEELRRTVLK